MTIDHGQQEPAFLLVSTQKNKAETHALHMIEKQWGNDSTYPEQKMCKYGNINTARECSLIKFFLQFISVTAVTDTADFFNAYTKNVFNEVIFSFDRSPYGLLPSTMNENVLRFKYLEMIGHSVAAQFLQGPVEFCKQYVYY